MLQIYNTRTRTREDFVPLCAGQVGMYVCGVTVYDLCHIGHARTFVCFDMIVRYLRWRGYQVRYVRNITDIDDKIIARAAERGVTPAELAAEYTAAMHEDFARLNLLPPDEEPRATEHIDSVIEVVRRLIERGHAYQASSGDVLFAIASFPGYGGLSGQRLQELQAGARVGVAAGKRHPLDFVLWKSAKPGEPQWPSPWGAGRPGWHIECSGMNWKFLGETFDIHGGGSDLIFPHHENELAQSCCAFGTRSVNYWMHSGMMMIGSEKMSKSLDNFFTIRDVLGGHDAESVRLFLLSGHYRSPLSYTPEHLEQARQGLARLYTALRGVPAAAAEEGVEDGDFARRFTAAMDDDFNTPQALAVLFDLARELNRAPPAQAAALGGELRRLGGVLGLLHQDAGLFLQGGSAAAQQRRIEELLEQRSAARRARDYAAADRARAELADMGIVVEDGPSGTTWRRA